MKEYLSQITKTQEMVQCSNMQVVGTEYGGWAVDLDLIPFGSTVISAGVGEDISFDLGLINLKDCKVIGIDPTEKAKKYVEKNKNERFDFLQKALYFESSKKVKIYKNTNPDYVSESIVPSHNMVAPSEFYEAETINIQDLLKKYENNSRVFGISGYTVSIPAHLLKSYPHDLYFCPRIGSWGWATWKRAWQHYEKDLRKLVKIANENNVDLTQGGTDIPISIENFLKGHLKDVWTLNWVLSVYANGGVYIYPTRSHINNIGMDGMGLHCGKTDKYDSPRSDVRPTRYPADIFLDERIMENFKSYYTAAPERSRRAVHFLKSDLFNTMLLWEKSFEYEIHTLKCRDEKLTDIVETEELFRQGFEQLKRGEALGTLKYLNEACKDHSPLPCSHFARAIALAQIGELSLAKDACQTELKFQPEHSGVKRLLERIEKTLNESIAGRQSDGFLQEERDNRLVRGVS